MVYLGSNNKKPSRVGRFNTCVLVSLFFLLSLLSTAANAAQVTLAWDANTDPELEGYRVYYGTQSRQYALLGDTGLHTTFTAPDLAGGTTYYFAVTAYDTRGLESDYSNEVTYGTATACTYAISPTSQSFTASAGAGTVSVTTQTGCSWTANGTSWMTITSGASGTGNGTVAYSVAANSTTSSRMIATTIADRTFSITQAGLSMYTITASAGTGGSISPSGSVSVTSGASRSFTITPASGYAISSITVDGVPVGAVSSYTFSNVAAGHTIGASFKASTYTLTVTKTGTGTGTVTTSPTGTSFTAGTAVTLTAAAASSSTFSGWSGACTGTSSTCKITMNGNTSVSADFTIRSYIITASAGTGGSISPSGSVSVTSGASRSFTITPASRNVIRRVTVDGVSVGAVKSYTFSGVTKTHTIQALFARR